MKDRATSQLFLVLVFLFQTTTWGWQTNIIHNKERQQSRVPPRVFCQGNEVGAEHQSDVSIDHNEFDSVWRSLQERFQGDFDNYNQVLEDRLEGRLPREGGGHENFHCTLIPLSENSRLAAFYFDGNPKRIFRFRYYELISLPLSKTSNVGGKEESLGALGGGVEMKLYTLVPELEGLLRQYSDQPLEWPGLFESFRPELSVKDKISYLPNCEITWSFNVDSVQHAYTLGSPEAVSCDSGVHAVMVHGEAIVDSTIIPGVMIRILDQLSLYGETFYINDRGLDPESGAFIYGNQMGVPYRLERVGNFVPDAKGEGKLRRHVLQKDLEWTMGPSWRTEESYQERIEAMGGLSAQMSRGPPKGQS